MSSDRLDDNKNLPPWLRDVPLPPRPRGGEARAEPLAPAQADAAGVQQPGEMPDWLRESQDAAVTPATPELPEWLSSSAQEPTSAQPADQSALPAWLCDTQPSSQPAAGAEQLPPWLSDLAGPSTQPPAPPAPSSDVVPPTTSQNENLPSWLADIAETSPGLPEPDPSAQESPSWLGNMAAEPAEDEPAGIPDWLGNQSNTSQPAGGETAPDWLGAQNEQSQPSGADLAARPAWLRDASDANQAPSTAPEKIDLWDDQKSAPPAAPAATGRANAQGDEQGIPSWLQDISAGAADADITAEPFSFEGATGTPPASADADITAEPFSFEGATGTPPASGSPSPPAWLTGASGGEDIAETVPDWLKEAVSQSEDFAEAAPAAPDVPLWLQDLDSTPTADAPITPEPTSEAPAQPEPTPPTGAQGDLPDAGVMQSPAADVPAWLRESQPAQPPAETTPAWLQESDAAQPPAADVPAWLRESQPAQPPAETTPAWLQESDTTQPATEDIPVWLRESQPEPSAAPNLPDWLRPSTPAQPPAGARESAMPEGTLPGMAPPNGAATPAEPAPSAPTSGDELPDWLRPAEPATPANIDRGQDFPPWLRDEAGQPLPTAGAAGDSNLPTWLRGAPTDAPPPAAATPAPAAPSSFDWLGLEEPQPESPHAPVGESEFFGGTELPAWLRPPEPEPAKEISPADARSLDWLTRLGGQEEPETISAVSRPALTLAPPLARTRTPAQIEALALLERLAADPFPTAAPAPAATQPSLLRRIGMERALYLALLIAIVIALAVPLPDTLGLMAPPTAPGAEQLFAQIDKLSEKDIVLVGYEWDARRNGELRPLEQAVLGHLTQKKVKLVLVSTDPQGTLLLFDFRDQLEQAGYRKGGEDYILLGYKPGAELALRSIAQDFRGVLRSDFQGNDATISVLATGTDASKPRLASLSDLSMMLVLADEASDVQGWMEQVHRVAKQVPLAFLLPAETTPLVQPYLSQPGIDHLAGKQGALAYQSLRGGGGMSAQQIALEASQQRLSLLVFVGLFLIGAIAMSTTMARRRKQS